MYSTLKLSRLLHCPETVSSPPDGPNSGYLVIQDDYESQHSCFATCTEYLTALPLPQNKELRILHRPFFIIPVLNQPLSSNRYYFIQAKGDHIGEAFCCFMKKHEDSGSYKPVGSWPLDPGDVCQQFELSQKKSSGERGFSAKTLTRSGFVPPSIIRGKFMIRLGKNGPFQLEEASEEKRKN